MMKAERAKARGGAPAAPSAPQAASAIAASAPSSSSPTDDYALPARADRPAFDAARPLARSAVGVAPARLDHAGRGGVVTRARARRRAVDALRGRRFQNLGGLPKPPPGGAREPLPPWSRASAAPRRRRRLDADAPPNRALNEYQPGQGIARTATARLRAARRDPLARSHCAFEFLRNDAARDAVPLLPLPPAALVFSDDAYHELLHTVPPSPPTTRRRRASSGSTSAPAAAAGRRRRGPPAHGAPRARAQPGRRRRSRSGAQRRRRALAGRSTRRPSGARRGARHEGHE